ncbi:hypothetical protein OC861_005311 [Tilletia horrida]|nr:hypothetical protein OC845_004629 [Tilletia horrida]KAK0562437.1 hypothetical protein OC861_005311 [Tilletia horrida]
MPLRGRHLASTLVLHSAAALTVTAAAVVHQNETTIRDRWSSIRGDPQDPSKSAPPPALSVPVAIVLGLIASFIQSVGIALQRGSHLQNDALPPAQRRAELRRPRWLLGFAIFMLGTVSTVLQIGALPIVILAPLGAVSLLYNAVLARFLLNTTFSKFMVAGTALIIIGAVLIALFGAITESPHSLDELLRLFSRPPFVACATMLAFVLFCVLFISHLAEWQLQIRIFRINLGPDYWKRKSGSTKMKKKKSKHSMRRRWSAPTLAPLAEVNENASGIATPAIAIADEAARNAAGYVGPSPRRRQSGQRRDYGSTGSYLTPNSARQGPGPNLSTTNSRAGTAPTPAAANGNDTKGSKNGGAGSSQMTPSSSTSSTDSLASSTSSHASSDGGNSAASAASSSSSAAAAATPSLADLDPGIRRTKTLLAVSYAGASGTLSGACLLLAKSGIELLVLSLTSRDNQFGRWQSWALVGVMLAAALLQLWYLNKALRFESPVLVMPLAFCFYNTASIALGLVYFDQLGALAWWNICLVVLGTIILLMGVWVVSLHSDEEVEAEREEEEQLASDFCASPIGLEPVPALVGTVMDERQPLLAAPTPASTAGPSPSTLKKSVSMQAPSDNVPQLQIIMPRAASGQRAVRRRAQSLAGGMAEDPESDLVSPSLRTPFTRRTPPERRAVHFLSRSASLSLGLGFAPAMQEEEEEDEEPSLMGSGPGPAGGGDLEQGMNGVGAGPGGLVASMSGGHGREGSSGTVGGAAGTHVPQLSYSSFLKRGLSIGIGVGSPGFYVQPTAPRTMTAAEEGDGDAVSSRSAEGHSRRGSATGTNGLLRSFSQFRIGRRGSGTRADGLNEGGARVRNRARLRAGRSASETDVADAYLEDTSVPPTAAAAPAAAEEEDEPMEILEDEVGDQTGTTESAGDSGLTVRTSQSQPQTSGWGTELDTQALADRLGQIAGWERVRRVFGLGSGRR